MRVLVSVIAAVFMLALPSLGNGRWGPQGCAAPQLGPVGPVVFNGVPSPPQIVIAPRVEQVAAYSWREIPDTSGEQHALYLGDKQVGTWSAASGKYRPIIGDRWGEATTPPVSPPQVALDPFRASNSIDAWKLNGVDTSKIGGDVERFAVSGVPRHKKHVFDLIEGDKVPDDGAFGYLVVVGPDAEKRKQVVDEFNADPALAELRAKTRIWSSSADHFSVKDRDSGEPFFGVKGNPTVVYMDVGGTVLHRQEGYTTGDVGALRKVNPGYDASKDPDVRKSGGVGVSKKTILLILGGAVLLYLFSTKGKS